MNILIRYIIFSVFLIQCCFADTVVNNIDDLKHFMIKLDSKLIIANDVYNPNNKNEWFTHERYKETFFNVIPNAVADCIAKRGVFAEENLENGMVVFKGTDPSQYTAANWNAVVFFNYIKKCHNKFILCLDPEEVIDSDDIYKELKQDLVKLYVHNQKEIERAYNEMKEYYSQFISIQKMKTFYDNNECIQDNRRWKGYMSYAMVTQNSADGIEAYILLNEKYLVNVFTLGKNDKCSIFIHNGKVSNLVTYSVIEDKSNKPTELETKEIFLDDYMRPVRTLKTSKIRFEITSNQTLYKSLMVATYLYHLVKTPIIEFILNDNETLKYECKHLRKYFKAKLPEQPNILFIMKNELVELMRNQKLINQDFIYETSMSIILYLIREYGSYEFLHTVKNMPTRSDLDLTQIPDLPNEFYDHDSKGDSDDDSE